MATKTIAELLASNAIDAAALLGGTDVCFEVQGDFGAGDSSGGTTFASLQTAILAGMADGVPIGATTPSSGAFTEIASDNIHGVNPAAGFTFSGGSSTFISNSTPVLTLDGGICMFSGWSFGWSSNNVSTATPDVTLLRAAADSLALRRGSNECEMQFGPSSTGIRSNADELEAFTFSGNSVTITNPGTFVGVPGTMTIDTDWTANANTGSTGAVVAAEPEVDMAALAASIDPGNVIGAVGIFAYWSAAAEKVKALQYALLNLKVPNA